VDPERELGREAVEFAATLAAADRQYKHVVDALDEVVVFRARELLANHDATSAWAVLTREVHDSLSARPEHVRFLTELLAAAVVRELAAEAGS
jgi:hypothetical protein